MKRRLIAGLSSDNFLSDAHDGFSEITFTHSGNPEAIDENALAQEQQCAWPFFGFDSVTFQAECLMEDNELVPSNLDKFSEEFRDTSRKRAEFIKNHKLMSSEWYLFWIYMYREEISWRRICKKDGRSPHGIEGTSDDGDPSMFQVGLGALCREFQLSEANKLASVQGKLDTERRRSGGLSRARPDRARILEAMRSRIERGQSIAQAARNAYAADGLGKSPDANKSLWKREQQKKQDQS